MADEIEKELNEMYEKSLNAKPIALVFSPYEIEHLLNLIQLGASARKSEIYHARRRRRGMRPLNKWEKHLLLMDAKVAQKIMKACRAAFEEEHPENADLPV